MIHISGLDTTGRYYGNIFTNASVVLGKDSLYEYSFWAKLRIDPQHPVTSRTIYAYVSAPSLGTNLATEFAIDTIWRKYTFSFRCAYGGGQSTGVIFSGSYGDVILDNFSIHRLPEIGLQPGETLAGNKIQRLPYAAMKGVAAARARDLVEFYEGLERSYFDAMQRTLRDTLHVAGLVNRSQTNYWGTLLDHESLRDGEVTEVHTGWDYVGARPGTAYSDSTWMIRNYSLTKDPGFSALSLAAAGSVVGKAHIVAWTVPNNNQTSSENALIPMTYASLQDWDGIFFSPYAVRRDEVLADSIIPGYPTYAWTNIASNHTFMALMPAASDAFRNHRIRTSSLLDTIHHDPSDVFLYPHYPDYRGVFGLEGFQYGDQGIVTSLKVRQQFNSRHQVAAENYYTPGDSLNRSETEEISYAPGMQYFRVQTPTLYGYTGFPHGDLEFPSLRVRRTDNSGDILSFYYLIDTAQHSALLSIGTRTQNTGTTWLDTLGYANHYGHAPTIMSAAKLELSIESNAEALEIQPLDSTGNPFGNLIATTRTADGGAFTATIDQKLTPTTWFYIQEKQTNSVTAKASDAVVVSLMPNPVMNRVSFVASLPISGIDIVDLLGRTLITTPPASNRTSLDATQLPEGSYTALVRLSNGSTLRKRFTVIR
jgi:hypothetical protein